MIREDYLHSVLYQQNAVKGMKTSQFHEMFDNTGKICEKTLPKSAGWIAFFSWKIFQVAKIKQSIINKRPIYVKSHMLEEVLSKIMHGAV